MDQRTKVCNRCGQEKSWDEYGRLSRDNDKPHPYCVPCYKEYRREYNQKNKDKARDRQRERVAALSPEENEERLQYYRDYRKDNIEAVKQKDKEKYYKNKETIAIHNKEYRQRPEVVERRKEYDKKNKEKRTVNNKAWREKNRDKINENDRNRKANSLKERLDCKISQKIWKCLKVNKGSKRGKNWRKVLGYTVDDLIKHLESQFDEHMFWDNYGSYWHIDHIVPQILFDYQDLEDPKFKECWGLHNLRPLEGRANSSKSDLFNGVRARDIRKQMELEKNGTRQPESGNTECEKVCGLPDGEKGDGILQG